MQTTRLLLHSLLCTLLLSGVAGCSTASGPGSASFASVKIKNHSIEDIIAATAQVFHEAEYHGGPTAGGKMLFEKEASRLSTISRDGLVAAQSGARTIERVRTEIVPLPDGSYRLQCEAFMVSGAGDSFFEDEVRKVNLRSGPYQKLLNQVAGKLK